MQVTTRVDTDKLSNIHRSLDDIATQLRTSQNRRYKATASVISELGEKMLDAAGVGRGAVRRPLVVCLCGSTRFHAQFVEASLQETLRGRIVLSIGAAVASDEEHFGHLSEQKKTMIKERLDELHLRKIDLSDEVLILNLGGYIGESTGRELVYAEKRGKTIRYLEPLGGGDATDKLTDDVVFTQADLEVLHDPASEAMYNPEGLQEWVEAHLEEAKP